MIQYEDVVMEIYLLTKDIWRDVWQSAATSAVVGGALTGIVSTTRVLNRREGKIINRVLRNLKS
jgi:hypothetical protein